MTNTARESPAKVLAVSAARAANTRSCSPDTCVLMALVSTRSPGWRFSRSMKSLIGGT
jgi:hypothetical protein